MSAFPGSLSSDSLGGRADSAQHPEWLDDLSRQIGRFVGTSAGEARALAEGLRRTVSAERLEQVLTALRTRWRRQGVVDAGALERAFRLEVREFGLERTIEHWTHHAVGPPSIRL